jgi:S-adenosylmethionine-diacylgycerolhomoserine-N-methlytransferase
MSAPPALADAEHGRRMDAIYRWQRHLYDATRKFYLLGRDGLIAGLDVPAGGSVLEIGCGTGRNLVLAARRYRDAKLFGIDISQVMLDQARRSLDRAGLSGRVTVAAADARAFDPAALFRQARFSRIFLSYTLSMVPGWQGAVSQGLAHLAPGGELHIVDFGRLEGWPRWFRAVLTRWLALFHVHPEPEIEAIVTAMGREAGFAVEVRRPFRGYAVHLVLRRATG